MISLNEKEYDNLLRIKTGGTLELLNQSAHYNRYEATPYEALDELFKTYELGAVGRLCRFRMRQGACFILRPPPLWCIGDGNRNEWTALSGRA